MGIAALRRDWSCGWSCGLLRSSVAVHGGLRRARASAMTDMADELIGFRQTIGTSWRTRAWVIWFQNVSPGPGITTADNGAAALFRPIIWTSVGDECSRSRTRVKHGAARRRANPGFARLKRTIGKRSRIASARLQMPGPAAMTRAPATPEGSPGPGFGGSSNGRTADSDSACLGSNPSPPATD